MDPGTGSWRDTTGWVEVGLAGALRSPGQLGAMEHTGGGRTSRAGDLARVPHHPLPNVTTLHIPQPLHPKKARADKYKLGPSGLASPPPEAIRQSPSLLCSTRRAAGKGGRGGSCPRTVTPPQRMGRTAGLSSPNESLGCPRTDGLPLFCRTGGHVTLAGREQTRETLRAGTLRRTGRSRTANGLG